MRDGKSTSHDSSASTKLQPELTKNLAQLLTPFSIYFICAHEATVPYLLVTGTTDGFIFSEIIFCSKPEVEDA